MAKKRLWLDLDLFVNSAVFVLLLTFILALLSSSVFAWNQSITWYDYDKNQVGQTYTKTGAEYPVSEYSNANYQVQPYDPFEGEIDAPYDFDDSYAVNAVSDCYLGRYGDLDTCGVLNCTRVGDDDFRGWSDDYSDHCFYAFYNLVNDESNLDHWSFEVGGDGSSGTLLTDFYYWYCNNRGLSDEDDKWPMDDAPASPAGAPTTFTGFMNILQQNNDFDRDTSPSYYTEDGFLYEVSANPPETDGDTTCFNAILAVPTRVVMKAACDEVRGTSDNFEFRNDYQYFDLDKNPDLCECVMGDYDDPADPSVVQFNRGSPTHEWLWADFGDGTGSNVPPAEMGTGPNNPGPGCCGDDPGDFGWTSPFTEMLEGSPIDFPHRKICLKNIGTNTRPLCSNGCPGWFDAADIDLMLKILQINGSTDSYDVISDAQRWYACDTPNLIEPSPPYLNVQYGSDGIIANDGNLIPLYHALPFFDPETFGDFGSTILNPPGDEGDEGDGTVGGVGDSDFEIIIDDEFSISVFGGAITDCDRDGDGYEASNSFGGKAGHVYPDKCEYNPLDCDDDNPNVHPGAIDFCDDDIDADCDGGAGPDGDFCSPSFDWTDLSPDNLELFVKRYLCHPLTHNNSGFAECSGYSLSFSRSGNQRKTFRAGDFINTMREFKCITGDTSGPELAKQQSSNCIFAYGVDELFQYKFFKNNWNNEIRNWSMFDKIEFYVFFASQYGSKLMFGTPVSGVGFNSYLNNAAFDGNIKDYIVGTPGLMKWNHVVIDIPDCCTTGATPCGPGSPGWSNDWRTCPEEVRSFWVYTHPNDVSAQPTVYWEREGGVTAFNNVIGVDKFHLVPSTTGSLVPDYDGATISGNEVCSGTYPYSIWVGDLDNDQTDIPMAQVSTGFAGTPRGPYKVSSLDVPFGRVACNSIPSYEWIGNNSVGACCGDDTTVNSITDVINRESFTIGNAEAGCIESNPARSGQRFMYFEYDLTLGSAPTAPVVTQTAVCFNESGCDLPIVDPGSRGMYAANTYSYTITNLHPDVYDIDINKFSAPFSFEPGVFTGWSSDTISSDNSPDEPGDRVELSKIIMKDYPMSVLFSNGTFSGCLAPSYILALTQTDPDDGSSTTTPLIANDQDKCEVQDKYFCDINDGWSDDASGGAMPWERNNTKNVSPMFAANVPVIDTDFESCCPADYCWNGKDCMNQDLFAQDATKPPMDFDNGVIDYTDDSGYRCIDGDWNWATKKFDWNKKEHGWCPSESMCLVNPTWEYQDNGYLSFDNRSNRPQCVESGSMIAEHYCNNGSWTTRTKLIALELLDYANMTQIEDYTLHCDRFDLVLNEYNYLGPEGSVSEGTEISKYIYGNYTDPFTFLCDYNSTIPDPFIMPHPDYCVNNFCVLVWNESEDQQNLIFGTSLNEKLGSDTAAGFESIFPEAEECVGKGADDWEACDASNTVWFNNNTHSIIYSKNEIEIRPLPDSFIDILVNVFRFLFNLVIPPSGDVIEYYRPPELDTILLEQFNAIYVNQKNSLNKLITAFKEVLWVGQLRMLFRAEYVGFTADICESIDQFDEEGLLPIFPGGPPELASIQKDYFCTQVANSYIVEALIPPDQDIGLQYAEMLPEITSRVRVKGAAALPFERGVGEVTATLGPDGGSLSLGTDNSVITLTIPQNAVPAPTTITISEEAIPGFLVQTSAGPGGVLSSFSLEPSGYSFNLPVTLTISYAESALVGPEDTIGIYKFNGVGYDLVFGSSCNTDSNICNTPLNDFSEYALIGEVVCGDEIVGPEEECDDGTANSDTDADACRTNCLNPSCGDGVEDSEEECDDGNFVDNDACSNSCFSN